MSDVTASRADTPPEDRRLPRFASRGEEAEFWDTHHVVDSSPIEPAELLEREAVQRAKIEPRAGLTEQLTVRLDRETYAAIVAEAREMGIGPTTLVRVWLRERLRAR